jgi:activating signal cointegrator complex subunit 2
MIFKDSNSDSSDEEGGANVKVEDGEAVSEGGSDAEVDAEGDKPLSNDPKSSGGVETILELAYIKDPKIFDRDNKTRKSKAREDLRKATGWVDEQLEGWRIMLDRNVSINAYNSFLLV